MNRLTVFVIALLGLTLSGVAALYFYQQKSADNFRCAGDYYSKSHDHLLRARISLTFYHGKGESFFDGEGVDEAGQVKSIRLASQFTWQRRGNFYQIRNVSSSRLLASALDAESTVNNIPYYFLEANRTITLRIYEDRTSSYLFTNGGIPIFYCKGR